MIAVMSMSLSFDLRDAAEPGLLHRVVARLSNTVAAAALFIVRVALLVFVAYAGSVIVQHVTQAMCAAVGHKPPAWTLTP
jgi:hypothetical protein